jgi:hypothetical protein
MALLCALTGELYTPIGIRPVSLQKNLTRTKKFAESADIE